MKVFGANEKIQKGSIRYIKDNRQDVTRYNQRNLVMLNGFYTVVLLTYLVASFTVFKEWNVTMMYEIAASVQVLVMLFVYIRYRTKHRTYKEVSTMCMAFQLYAMTFVGVMSIFPVKMNQPAVYFVPIAMGFVASFIFTFNQAITLAAIEMGVYVVFSFIYKKNNVFAIDACSCLLAFFMIYFLGRILYMQRANENESRQRIRRMGMMDSLTGLYNKASSEFLTKNFIKTKPQQTCVMMILDFDNFKFVNDTYGHQAGDVVLRSFGRILKHEAEDEHVAGRIGGDEFYLFLKDTSAAEAEVIAERILNRTRIIQATDGTRPFSCSIGISFRHVEEMNGKTEDIYKSLFSRADQVLYQVKENGKNNYMIES